MKTLPILYFFAFSVLTLSAQTNYSEWSVVDSNGTFTLREENSCMAIGDDIYFIGGRGKMAVDVYHVPTGNWRSKGLTPLAIHHFQAVKHEEHIYVVCAQTGPYPHETPLATMLLYNPAEDCWKQGDSIPANRRRGSAGCVVYNDKIYVVCGIVDGHWDGHVTWFDEYDPTTGAWKTLPDAPHARDHFEAVVLDDKLYCIGGRRSYGANKQVFTLTVPFVDVYDFKTGSWETLEEQIPTQRAGATTVVVNNEIVVIGGESNQPLAHDECEAFNPVSKTWRSLPKMTTPRHGTTAVTLNNSIFIGAGASKKGGMPKVETVEMCAWE